MLPETEAERAEVKALADRIGPTPFMILAWVYERYPEINGRMTIVQFERECRDAYRKAGAQIAEGWKP